MATLTTPGLSCPHGEQCEHFQNFKAYNFSLDAYHHMTSVEHTKVPCKHGRACHAHARLCAGARDFNDVCHCTLYTHGRAELSEWPEGVVSIMSQKDNSYCNGYGTDGHQAFYGSHTAGQINGLPVDEKMRINHNGEDLTLEQKLQALDINGVDLICSELRAHGLEHEMHLLNSVVPTLREHPRLKEAEGSVSPCKLHGQGKILSKIPVTDLELFSLLLYTGTEAQGMLRKALRSTNGDKTLDGWWWTIQLIRHAVIKLSEPQPQTLYHGLNGVVLIEQSCGDKGWKTGLVPNALNYANFISTSMSKEIATVFAVGAGGTVKQSDAHMVGTVLCFPNIEREYAHELAIADMRWISKFPDEQEWLMMPLGFAGNVPAVKCDYTYVHRHWTWADGTRKYISKDTHVANGGGDFLVSSEKRDGPNGKPVTVNYHDITWRSTHAGVM